MAIMANKKHPAESINESFIGILVGDVELTLERVQAIDSQYNRRDLVRTTIAAIEGVTWVFRQNIQSVATDIDSIPPDVAAVFSETFYSVNEQGKITQQSRFVPLLAIIRLTANLAKQICPNLILDFSQNGWADLKQAIIIRNRITHPKNKRDLYITLAEIAVVRSGFVWLLSLTQDAMEAANAESAFHLHLLRTFTDLLIAGDKNALAEYQKALDDLED